MVARKKTPAKKAEAMPAKSLSPRTVRGRALVLLGRNRTPLASIVHLIEKAEALSAWIGTDPLKLEALAVVEQMKMQPAGAPAKSLAFMCEAVYAFLSEAAPKAEPEAPETIPEPGSSGAKAAAKRAAAG